MPRRKEKFENHLYYHVYNRGVSKTKIFHNNVDSNRFIKKTKYYATKFNVKIYAYAVMQNHYHFLISGEQIMPFLRSLQHSHANYFNIKYGHSGCVFESRYKAKAILTADYFDEVKKYIAKNPLEVKASSGVSGITVDTTLYPG